MTHHPPAMPSTNPAAPSATYTPLRTRKPITATARSRTATSETMARTRARAGEVRLDSATWPHSPLLRCVSPGPVALVPPGRRRLRCRWVALITVHHSLVLDLTAL